MRLVARRAARAAGAPAAEADDARAEAAADESRGGAGLESELGPDALLDPHPLFKQGVADGRYAALRLAGRLGAFFPARIDAAREGEESAGVLSGDVISVDWCPPDTSPDGNRLRLQLDRVFTTPDGSLDSLELTEALAYCER